MSLRDKVIFMSGCSRGIGFAIAERAARDGARIVVTGKTAEAHRYLPGTVFSAAKDLEAMGAEALPVVMDVRSEESVAAAVDKAVAAFGGIDICVNNASAINLAGTLSVSMKQFDLMNAVNVRGTFLVSKACLPHLLKAVNPHVLTMAPPLDLNARWFAPHAAYSIAKFGMSLATLAMGEEFKSQGVAFNALWPRTPIATAAIEFGVPNGKALMAKCRTPQIMADAAYEVLNQPARTYTGGFLIDDEVLFELGGVRDFEDYRVSKDTLLATDLFVSRDRPMPPGMQQTFA
jgi:citronellol/citronellal dehydrogenase